MKLWKILSFSSLLFLSCDSTHEFWGDLFNIFIPSPGDLDGKVRLINIPVDTPFTLRIQAIQNNQSQGEFSYAWEGQEILEINYDIYNLPDGTYTVRFLYESDSLSFQCDIDSVNENPIQVTYNLDTTLPLVQMDIATQECSIPDS